MTTTANAFGIRSLHINNQLSLHSSWRCVGNCFQKEVFAYYKQLDIDGHAKKKVGNCFQKEVFAYYKQLIAAYSLPVQCWELLSKRGLCILQTTWLWTDNEGCTLGIAFKKRSLHITNNTSEETL